MKEGGHIHMRGAEINKAPPRFVYAPIMPVCAAADAPQMGEECAGSSGNRITWARN